MSFYQKNLEILSSLFPSILKKLDVPVAQEIETVVTNDGQISFRRLGGIWLHSTRAPIREAERLILKSIPEACPFCLFYGFGLAYHLESFIKKHRNTPFAVVEPDVTLFKTALTLRDFTEIFKSPGFSLALGASPDSIPALLDGKPHKNIQICMLRSAVENNRKYFESCEKIVNEYLSRKEINANTLDKFSRLWVSNICRNLPMTSKVPGIRTLKGRFLGVPALLLAAGPTLEEVLPLLGEIRKRFLLVCVDTALKACLRVGIEPDFLILTDPQYWNSRHLDRCITAHTILISDVSTYPAPLRAFKGTIFFCSTPFPLGQFFESRTEIKGKLKSGGSVSTAAWDFLRFSGISKIYCAGLDLSFPDGETHYRGSTFEERLHGFSHRKIPVETSSWLALMGGNPYLGKNHRDEPVLTDQRMKIYIHWFQEQMKLNQNIKTSQLSPRGIALEGMDWEDPHHLLTLPEIRENKIDRILGEIRLIQCEVPKDLLIQSYNKLLEELDDLINLTKQGVKISEQVLQTGIEPENLEKLNQIDQAILNRESREMAGFILAPILEDLFTGSNQELSKEKILSRSLDLYTRLNASLSFHKDMILTIDFGEKT